MTRRNLRGRMRRLAAPAIAAVAAVILSSCVAIPTSGAVITGREITAQDIERGSEVIPEGPVAGADQQAILSGFIAAHSGSRSYDVARQFLSRGFADDWDPGASVLIRSGSSTTERLGENSMAFSIVVSATVDRDGMYNEYPAAPQTLVYEFIQENGEWRINAAPDGVVLSSGTFPKLFTDHTLYFLDANREALVPDVRWFPNGTAAFRVVSALLNGPPAWLQGAVGTAFPEGTQLSSPRRVAIEENVVAVVDLTEEALSANDTQRQLMRLQLEASLGAVPSVSSAKLTVGGTPLEIAPLRANAPQLRPQVDSRLLALRDGEFGYLANDRVTAIDGLSEKVVATNPTDVTLAATGTVAATLGQNGVSIVRSGVDNPLLVDGRPGLIAPTMDSYGYVWTVQRADPGSIRVSDLEGNSTALTTTLPRDGEIVSLEIARDGTRIAALLATDAGTRLVVSSIIRDQNQAYLPVSWGSEPRIDRIVDRGVALDATWVDELSVATLSEVAGSVEVVSQQIGGKQNDLGSPGPAVSIVGGNTEAGLRVLAENGVISTRRGSGWQSSGKATLIATQR